MHVRPLLLAAAVTLSLTGCASGLNSHQKAELRHYEASGLAVQEKDTATAALLGLLPGGGSFYSREYGVGIANLLFWPLSILWDPISGHDAAEAINYTVTKAHVSRLERQALDTLDDQLQSGEIDAAQYNLEKRKIQRKYAAN